MNFCTKCDFMYYIKVNEEDELKYYCRNCGHEDNEHSVSNLKVSVYEKTSNTQKHINAWINNFSTIIHWKKKYPPLNFQN